MKYRIITYIGIFQVIVIGVFVYNIFSQKRVLGVAVNTISNESVKVIPSGNLKHFFEPVEGNQPDPNKSFSISNSINVDTLNERFEYKPMKEKGTYRVVALGDSFTFGLHVSTDDNWTELLEEKLNKQFVCTNISKFEVINLGVSGYDRAYAVERFKKRGVKYSPDLVMWLDTSPFRDTEKIYRRLEKLPEGIPPTRRHNEYYIKVQNELVSEASNSDLENTLFSSTLEINKYYDGQLLLLTFPFMSSAELQALEKIPKLRKETSFYSNLPDLYKNNLAFENDGHPNSKGHKVISEDIINHLISSKLIPCK